MSSVTDRTFAEVRPLFNAWLVRECGTPIELALRHAGIPIRYVVGLTHPYGVGSDTHGFAVALLPARLASAPPADRAAALRVCVLALEEDHQYRTAARIWDGLSAWLEAQEQAT